MKLVDICTNQTHPPAQMVSINPLNYMYGLWWYLIQICAPIFSQSSPSSSLPSVPNTFESNFTNSTDENNFRAVKYRNSFYTVNLCN